MHLAEAVSVKGVFLYLIFPWRDRHLNNMYLAFFISFDLAYQIKSYILHLVSRLSSLGKVFISYSFLIEEAAQYINLVFHILV